MENPTALPPQTKIEIAAPISETPASASQTEVKNSESPEVKTIVEPPRAFVHPEENPLD
jgi:hypothetical protein